MGRVDKHHKEKKSRKKTTTAEEILGKNADRVKNPGRQKQKKAQQKEAKPKKILNKILIAIVLLFALVTGGSLAYQYFSQGYISSVVPFTSEEELFEGGEMTMLMLGSDKRADGSIGGQRSDTIVIGRFNFNEGTARVISIPRDTLVKIPGYEATKINAAYSYGGVALTKKTIEDFYGITIDRTVEIDFESFKEAVDILGGVEIVMDEPLYSKDWGLNLQVGPNILDGGTALDFVRFRGTPTADLGRIKRQQLFLRSLAHDIKTKANIFEQVDILSNLFGDLTTDLTFNELIYMFNSYKKLDNFQISSWTSAGETGMINGGSYVIPDKNIMKMAQGFLDGTLVVTEPEQDDLFPELVTPVEKAKQDREIAQKAAQQNAQ